MASLVWLGLEDGFWDQATNWQGGTAPGSASAADDVIVRVPGLITTTHRSGNTVIRSLTSDEGLTLSGGSLTVGTTLQINNVLRLSGGTLAGATVTLGPNGSLDFSNSFSNSFSGVALQGDLNLLSDNFPRLRLQQGATFTGDARITGSGASLIFEQTSTLNQRGTIYLGGTTGSIRQFGLSGDHTLTLGPNLTVRGGLAAIRSDLLLNGNGVVINQGRIVSDIRGQTLDISPDSFTNRGVVEAIANTTLALGRFNTAWGNAPGGTIRGNSATLNFSGDWQNSGRIELTNTTLNLGGTFTTADLGLSNVSIQGGAVNLVGDLINTNDVLRLNSSTGSWMLSGGSITGGAIATSGANLEFSNSFNNRLSGVELRGDLTVQGSIFARLRLQQGSRFTGNAYVTGDGASLLIEQSGIIDNGGTIVLGGSSINRRQFGISGDHTLTLGPSMTVRGGRADIRSDLFLEGTGVIVNQGRIAADLAGESLVINLDGFTNTGTVEAIGGGILQLDSRPTNLVDGTLTGGTWRVTDGSTLIFPGAATVSPIVTNAASLVLDGANARLLQGTSTAPGLAGLTTNAAAGRLTLRQGHQLTTVAGLENAGQISLESGSRLAVSGAYRQTGGQTRLQGGRLTSNAGSVSILGGELSGMGTIDGSLTNQGAIATDGTAGTLSILGGYTQTATGVLNLELGGTNRYDQLQISGTATLDGRLNIRTLTGFAPQVGDSFKVLDFGSVSGRFAAINGLELGGGLFLEPDLDGDRLLLSVYAPPIAQDDAFTTDEVTPLTLLPAALLANDTDADDEVLSITAIDSANTIGQVTFDGSRIVYSPNDKFDALAAGETATDRFTYTVRDKDGYTDTATVVVTIQGLNTAPVAQNDALTASQNTPLLIPAATLLANDYAIDANSLLRIVDVVAVDEPVVPAPGVPAAVAEPIVTEPAVPEQVATAPGGAEPIVTEAAPSGADLPPSAPQIGPTDPADLPVEPIMIGLAAENSSAPDPEVSIPSLVADRLDEPSSPPAAPVSEGSALPDAPGALQETIFDRISTAGGTVTLLQDAPDDARDRLIYMPPADFVGTDRFSYTISDGQGGTASATVVVIVESAASTSDELTGTPQPILNGEFADDNGLDQSDGPGPTIPPGDAGLIFAPTALDGLNDVPGDEPDGRLAGSDLDAALDAASPIGVLSSSSFLDPLADALPGAISGAISDAALNATFAEPALASLV